MLRANPLSSAHDTPASGPLGFARTAWGFVAGLAPMANVTNAPFRALALSYGCGVAPTEMLSARALVHGDTFEGFSALRLERAPGPGPHVVQLLGGDPELMAEAGRRVEAEGVDALDVNMGCPIRRIAHGESAGVALMRSPERAAAVVAALVRAVKVPVTVKLRAGVGPEALNAVTVARALEDAGAALLTVHARTADAAHSGPARLEVVSAVKAAVRVPVFGNGGITTATQARDFVVATGCDGVLIGRGAVGNPWLFASLARGEEVVPWAPERLRALASHLELYARWGGEGRALREGRKLVAPYLRGVEGGEALRAALFAAADLEAALALLEVRAQSS